MYKDQNLIYTEYKKGSPTFMVKKWKQRVQNNNGVQGSDKKSEITALIESKFAEPLVKKEGQSDLIFSDETIQAYREEKQPVAKVHIVVTTKEGMKGLKDLREASEEHKELLGHMMRVVAKIAKEQGLEEGYRTVINNGVVANQTDSKLQIHIIGGQQLTWPPGTAPAQIDSTNPEVNDLCNKFQNNFKLNEEEKKEEENKNALKEEMFLRELGVSHIIEMIINRCKVNPQCCLIGHNMIYDIIYLYNQFIGPLPETYADFVAEWFKLFPSTFDTKVCSFKADYFGKTILGKIFEKCQGDKRLKDIIHFNFDIKNGFINYHGSELLSHYHEAAYDAYMTGYSFCKILKYKEIDEVFNRKKMEKNKKGGGRKGGKKSEENKEEANSVDPKDVKDTPVNFNFQFSQANLNKVMMNQFDNCACFHMNPDKKDAGATDLDLRQEEVIWMKFKDEYQVAELSAETIASIFSAFGDFYVFKDSKQSIILHFYYFDGTYLEDKSTQGFINKMNAEMNKYHLAHISTLSKAPKFVAHNHLE